MGAISSSEPIIDPQCFGGTGRIPNDFDVLSLDLMTLKLAAEPITRIPERRLVTGNLISGIPSSPSPIEAKRRECGACRSARGPQVTDVVKIADARSL